MVNGVMTIRDLTALPVWVAWKFIDGNKIPLNPNMKGGAKANDPSTWGTREQAETAAAKFMVSNGWTKPAKSSGGIGLELTTISKGVCLGGVDLDSCRSEDGTVAPWAAEVMKIVPSYAEVSPSGKGIKIFFRFKSKDLPALLKAAGAEDGGRGRKWASAGGNHPPAVELYLSHRYFAVTEDRVGDNDDLAIINAKTIERLRIVAQRLLPKETEAAPDESRSAEAFRACLAFRRYNPESDFDAMCLHLSELQNPAVQEWLAEKGDKRALQNLWKNTEEKAQKLADRDQFHDDIEKLITKLNDRYMLVNEAGRALIFSPRWDKNLKRSVYTRMLEKDFRLLLLNDSINVGIDEHGVPKTKTAADVWLRHPGRRQYLGGVVFDPTNNHEPDELNLWHGFSVEPKRGKWDKLQDHVKIILCNKDQVAYDYLIGWMARMVQLPAEQGEVAIVMRGGEGSGKGTLARVIMRLFGQHAMTVSNHKHLIGNFNAHLRDCVFLFPDECFYAGDKQHAGVLKAIITEPTVTMEAKHFNAVLIKNTLHVMMTSNNTWVIPAALDARRFLMLNVSNAKANNIPYFAAIWSQMEVGGYEAMLYDLMNYDLSKFDVRSVPQTVGLNDQKKLSLEVIDSWWMDVLSRGYLRSSVAQWSESYATGDLYADYLEYAEKRMERHPIHRNAMGEYMRKMKSKSQQRVPVGLSGYAPGYHVGKLLLARKAFEEVTGLKMEWEGV